MSEHHGTVLHVIPADIEVFDQEVLSFWMTEEASAGVVARAAVVPSGITAFTASDGCSSLRTSFRVFRNPQVAKGWLIDCWLQHQETQAGHAEVQLSSEAVLD